jgi:hypothetical protein
MKVVNLVKIGSWKTCGFLEFLKIIKNFFVNIGQKMNKIAEVVCFGAKILTSIIHSLLLNEGGSIKRHKIFLGKCTTGYCKSKNFYRSFNFINLLLKEDYYVQKISFMGLFCFGAGPGR